MVCPSTQRPLPPLLRLAISAVLVPGLATPMGGLAQNDGASAGTLSIFDPIQIPDEPGEQKSQPEPNDLRPWWTTNQPPSALVRGPQLGTDVLSILNPGFNALPPPPGGAQTVGTPPILRWGPVTAHPRLSYAMSYGNGVAGAQSRDQNTFVNTISPSVMFELGERWTLNYSPTIVSYTAQGLDNVVNQNASISGSGVTGDWSLGFGNSFSMTDNPLVETGVQTQQTQNSTSLSASRPITPVLSVNLGVSQALRWAQDFNNTFSWSTLNGVNYQLRSNMTVGANIGFGYDMVDPGNDMTNERLLVSVGGLIGPKLSYSLSGGFEVRQFLETDAEMKLSPLVNASLQYPITEKTSVNLQVSRQVSPSFFNDQFAESAAISGGFSQRLFGRFFLSASGGYRWTDNNSTFNPTQTVQTQNFAFAQVSIGARILRRGSASIFYSWSSNSSNLQGLDFNSNQVGLSLGYGW